MSLAAMLSALVAGHLDSTVRRGFQATLLGLAIGPIDTIYTVSGLLALAAGLYAARQWREVRLNGDR